jgi:hypothetical protein
MQIFYFKHAYVIVKSAGVPGRLVTSSAMTFHRQSTTVVHLLHSVNLLTTTLTAANPEIYFCLKKDLLYQSPT